MGKAKKEMSLDEVKKILANEFDFNANDASKEIAESEVEITETEAQSIDINMTEPKSDIDYVGRGFTSLQDAVGFVNTDKFKKWGKADREEYLNWLNK